MNNKELIGHILRFLVEKGYNHPDDRDDLFVGELFDMLEEES